MCYGGGFISICILIDFEVYNKNIKVINIIYK